MSNATYRVSLTLALLQARASAMSFSRPVLNEHGVTSQQWRVIRVLRQNGHTEIYRLAELACILKPSLTGVLKRMEAQGLVSRQRSEIDQRCVLVSLSSRGQALYGLVEHDISCCYDRLEMGLGRDSLRDLLDLLDELKEISPINQD
ncbi:homoprotocatechuate degradation operon regulator HpaR [Pseudomonas sp. NMI542_15]|uniref:homoprotocatechuate degradation operon regulator HpaR n=1 Tax=Pseudomonas sp. NMI542_15 TaxID=2903148 RepID=UPI001E5AC878|nr:homoprotocatechuate degradation operon regulator HpaR [Pseudomonas sp. NMI542_15]MCE0777577.1 homoprotocatechuate degradation operon regulator HpaR [Pseudomonas sp. NMI542_15]